MLESLPTIDALGALLKLTASSCKAERNDPLMTSMLVHGGQEEQKKHASTVHDSGYEWNAELLLRGEELASEPATLVVSAKGKEDANGEFDGNAELMLRGEVCSHTWRHPVAAPPVIGKYKKRNEQKPEHAQKRADLNEPYHVVGRLKILAVLPDLPLRQSQPAMQSSDAKQTTNGEQPDPFNASTLVKTIGLFFAVMPVECVSLDTKTECKLTVSATAVKSLSSLKEIGKSPAFLIYAHASAGHLTLFEHPITDNDEASFFRVDSTAVCIRGSDPSANVTDFVWALLKKIIAVIGNVASAEWLVSHDKSAAALRVYHRQ